MGADLVREGFELVQDLRLPADASGVRAGCGSSPQSLETFLVALLALDDFDADARRLRALPDSARKFSAWLHVARRLGQAR